MFSLTRRQSTKSSHPLSSAGSTAKILDELSKRESLSALQGISELLDALKTARGLDLVRAFEIVDQLDRLGRPHWGNATHEYYAGAGQLTNYQATRIWTGVGEYLVQLAEAYELCLASYATGTSGSAGLAGQLVRIIGRALRLRVSAHSWDYVRYASQFGRWGEVYRLYQLAENRGCTEQKVVLYRGGRFCTVEQEFMQALMLAVAAPHGMRPEQIDAADRIAARLAHYFSLADSKATGSYYFDPASDNPPLREQPGIRPPLTARRFGPGEAASELTRLADRAKQGDLRLAEFGVDRHSEEIVLPTLLHLLRYWSEAPPERRHTRRREPKRISVVHGFEEVVAKVGNLASAYPFVSAQETWLIENAGAGGIGALASKPQGSWVAIGSLIAFRAPEAGIWNLGVVRHLTDESADRFIGIELVSQGGVSVSLRRATGRHGGLEEGLLGVWLAAESPRAGHIKLLVPRGLYLSSSLLLMNVNAREYLLSPHGLVLEGSDHQVAHYMAELANDGTR
jgi:hypothetical protein